MRNQRETIAQMLKDDPSLKERKNRYILAARMTGVDPETCKIIASILDEYRHQTVADERGLELEAEWHKPSALWKFETESERLKKDKLLYA